MRTLRLVALFAVIGWSAGQTTLPEILSQEIEQAMSKRDSSTCTGKWKTIKDSTMCVSRDSPSAKDCGVSEEEKQEILKVHNRLRSKVSPSSSDMLKMYWNDDLAVVAQKWAKHGQSAHDTNVNRQIPGSGRGMFIGQCWASGGIFPTWTTAIEGWYSEVKDFSYGSSYHGGVVGHYTQVVQGAANLVGCGKCTVNNVKPLYICNYYRGNSQDTGHPYIKGPQGGNCKKVVDGLCDCGDMMCKNNGTMNAKTCTCDCEGEYKGNDCGDYNCPEKDDDACDSFFKGKCDIWSNVPGKCPFMCGMCKKGGQDGNGNDDKNGNDDDNDNDDGDKKGNGDDNDDDDNDGDKKGKGDDNDNDDNKNGGKDDCKDENKSCGVWAKAGYCKDAHPRAYVPNHCKKSCKSCD